MKKPPHVARLHRVDASRLADEATLRAAADRLAGQAGWSAVAGWSPSEVDCRLFNFATPAKPEATQRWSWDSGIEMRRASEPYSGPQITVPSGKTC